jgi:hypothetical protein
LTRRTADDPDFIEIFINEHELDFTQFVENDLAILDTLKIDRKRKSMDTLEFLQVNLPLSR